MILSSTCLNLWLLLCLLPMVHKVTVCTITNLNEYWRVGYECLNIPFSNLVFQDLSSYTLLHVMMAITRQEHDVVILTDLLHHLSHLSLVSLKAGLSFRFFMFVKALTFPLVVYNV